MLKNKKLVLTVLLVIAMVLNIESVSKDISMALNVCATVIVPSLFVFMVFSDMIVTMLLSEETIRFSPKTIAFFMGTFCGFPIGATVCENMCKNNLISKDDAAKIIPFCNNASPAFLLGAVGASMLGDKRLGVVLFISQTLSSALPIMFIKIKNDKSILKNNPACVQEAFLSAIEKSVAGILKVCALICVFSAILALLKQISLSFLAIPLEISNGAAYCAEMYKGNPSIAFALCGFCCGFSGLCVHMQIKSMLKTVEISMSRLFFCELLQGVVCSMFSLAGYYLLF